MVSKAPTWEEIKTRPAQKKVESQATPTFWPHLCPAWGITKGQIVFCRQNHGHNGLHYGFFDPNTRYGWRG